MIKQMLDKLPSWLPNEAKLWLCYTVIGGGLLTPLITWVFSLSLSFQLLLVVAILCICVIVLCIALRNKPPTQIQRFKQILSTLSTKHLTELKKAHLHGTIQCANGRMHPILTDLVDSGILIERTNSKNNIWGGSLHPDIRATPELLKMITDFNDSSNS